MKRRKRKRTLSETRGKTPLLLTSPLHFLATGEELSLFVYDCNGKFSLEPFFHFIIDQPSIKFEFLGLNQRHSVKVICFDLTLKTYAGKPIKKNEPFLPVEDDFSTSWISSREGMTDKENVQSNLLSHTSIHGFSAVVRG